MRIPIFIRIRDGSVSVDGSSSEEGLDDTEVSNLALPS